MTDDRRAYNRTQKANRRAILRNDEIAAAADTILSAIAEKVADRILSAQQISTTEKSWSDAADTTGTPRDPLKGVPSGVVPGESANGKSTSADADADMSATAFDADVARVNVRAVRDALVEMNPRPIRRRRDLE